MRLSAPLLARFLPALLAAAPSAAAAQASAGATLVVHVVDEKGAPLPGASVAVRGLNRAGTTDGTGEARIAQIPQGNRVVEVRREGYRTRRVPTAFTSGQTVLREVDLVPTAAELDTVAAVARRNARNAPRSLLLVTVLDEKGAPIQGAYVTVGGVEHGASTDREGVAKLAAIPQGNRLVEVKRQGYAYRRVAADFVGGDTVRKEVAMTPAPIELEGIVVTTWGRSMALVRNGFYDRQRRGFGAFMTRQRLDEIRPYHTTEAFRYMRGFMVVPMGSTDVVVGSRGGGLRGACLPSVYIDGMLMFVMNARDEADAINMVSPDDIEAIEAFQGSASIPAQYNPTGSACGVILIWTRR
jgi:hypothetical protein